VSEREQEADAADAVPLSWLGGLVAVAALVRLLLIERQSFWYDEAVAVALARHPLGDLFAGRVKDLGNPPLFPALLHVWMRVFGSSDAAVRALPAALGTATVPLVYAVGRRFMTARAAWVGALLFALAPYQVQMAQEARAYTLLTCAGVASVAALLAALEQPRRWSLWALHAACTAALPLAHYFGWLLVLAEVAFVLIDQRGRGVRTRAAASFALAALPFALWLPSLLEQLRVEGNLARSPDSWLFHLLATPLVFGAGSTLLWKGSVTAARVALGLGAVAAFGAAVLLGAWRLRSARGTALLGLWLALPLAVPALVSVLVTPLYSSRYAILASVPFYLFAAAGLLALRRPARLACAGVMAAAMLAAQASYFAHPVKHDWRDAVRFVEARLDEHDVVLFEADYNGTAYDHYARRPGPRVRLMPPPPQATPGELHGVTVEGDDPADVSALLKSRGRAWLVLSDARPEDAERARRFFSGWLAAPPTHFPGVEIELYTRPGTTARR
jgi:mannosyltransferase